MDDSNMIVLHVPLTNDNYELIFGILARISDCEELIRKADVKSEGYYVKFRYDEPAGLIYSIDNGTTHLKTVISDLTYANPKRLSTPMANYILKLIFSGDLKSNPEYNVFIRMTGNIYKDNFACRLFFYNDKKKFRINFKLLPKTEIREDIRKKALEHVRAKGENAIWLNEHLVGSYI